MEFPPDKISRNGAQVSSPSVLGKRRRVGLVYDERMCKHSTPKREPHPENPDRIRTIWDKLVSAGIPNRCVVFNAKQVEDKYIAAVHTKSYINLIKTVSSKKISQMNKVAAKYDSIYFNKGSSESAYLAAGSVLEVAEKVAKGELNSAFAIVRPPGHHAEKSEPMGFCLFNNVAIATRFLLDTKELGVNKILVVDWDVHHGNGTQKMFYKDPRVLVFSVHRHEHGSFYPTGEDGSHIMTGEGRGAGYNINVPWENDRCGDADYIAVWDHILIPVAKEFNPDMILISAGFDAAVGDPLGGCCVTPHGFSMLLMKLMGFSRGKIIMALGGGYNLNSLANSVLACVEVFLEDKPIAGSMEVYPFESTWGVIKAVREQLSTFWPILAYKLPRKLTSRVTPEVQIYSSQSGNDYDDGLNTSSVDLQDDVTMQLRDLVQHEDTHVTVASQAWRPESLEDVASIKNKVLATKEDNKSLERVVKADKKADIPKESGGNIAPKTRPPDSFSLKDLKDLTFSLKDLNTKTPAKVEKSATAAPILKDVASIKNEVHAIKKCNKRLESVVKADKKTDIPKVSGDNNAQNTRQPGSFSLKDLKDLSFGLKDLKDRDGKIPVNIEKTAPAVPIPKDVASTKNEVLAIKEGNKRLERVVKADKKTDIPKMSGDNVAENTRQPGSFSLKDLSFGLKDLNGKTPVNVEKTAPAVPILKDVASTKNEALAIKEGNKRLERVIKADKKTDIPKESGDNIAQKTRQPGSFSLKDLKAPNEKTPVKVGKTAPAAPKERIVPLPSSAKRNRTSWVIEQDDAPLKGAPLDKTPLAKAPLSLSSKEALANISTGVEQVTKTYNDRLNDHQNAIAKIKDMFAQKIKALTEAKNEMSKLRKDLKRQAAEIQDILSMNKV